MKHWIKYRTEYSIIIVIIMLYTGAKYDMFFHPEKHKILVGLFLVLFVIAMIPYAFRNE